MIALRSSTSPCCQHVLSDAPPPAMLAQFALVAPLLPEATQRKISIYSGANTAAALLEFIDAAELPRFLGGDRADEQSSMPCCRPLPAGSS